MKCRGESAFYWPENRTNCLPVSFVEKQIELFHSPVRLVSDPGKEAPWDLIILDHFKTSRQEYKKISQWGPVMTLDEGGSSRDIADFLIDTLPHPLEKGRANLFDISLLELPFGEKCLDGNRLLVVFGGQGNQQLTEQTIKRLTGITEITNFSVDIIGDRENGNSRKYPDNFRFLSFVPELKWQLKNYSHVITYFGLTAYEAASSGCRVLLLNPGAYHEKLAALSGFASGVKDKNILKNFLNSETWYTPQPIKPERLLWERLNDRDFNSPRCPLCGSRKRKIIARAEEKSYFLCRDCGMEFLYRPLGEIKQYDRDYFFEDYEKQYGKSYLDDFGNIYRQCLDRMKIIDQYGGEGKKTLLDIGCAFGPFLKAASDLNWSPCGIDISEEAVAHVKNRFSYPAVCGDFLNLSFSDFPGEAPYDAVSLWYVIEHFPDLNYLLDKINRIMKPGAILAFSTPNAGGGSRRFAKDRFFIASPDDHFSLWRPSATRGWLDRYGFDLKEIRITGHHPERIHSVFKREKYRSAGMKLSRLFGWGDTFEVYAVKRREIE